MSTQSSDDKRYFHCADFAITMQVSECKERRRASTLPGFDKEAQGLNCERLSARFMTKRCAECTLFQERTSEENTITHDQMMRRLEDEPSVQPSSDGQKAYYGSLRTPHKMYGNYR